MSDVIAKNVLMKQSQLTYSNICLLGTEIAMLVSLARNDI
jgi:hypothetical protein